MWGEQWPFSESPQQTLPMKLVHHLEQGQDHRQNAIDSTGKARAAMERVQLKTESVGRTGFMVAERGPESSE